MCYNACHSPCGSVDWNILPVRTAINAICHSPCGSVDWNKSNMTGKSRHKGHSLCGSVDWNFVSHANVLLPLSHSLCGSVDWNKLCCRSPPSQEVTPLMGVWIEIYCRCELRLMRFVTPLVGVWIEMTDVASKLICFVRHSPCGSVDWN